MPQAYLVPLWTEQATTLPAFLGPFAFAALGERLAASAPGIFAGVQDDIEPVTVAVLYDGLWLGQPMTAVVPDRPLWLRITVIDDALASSIQQAIAPATLMTLAGWPFRVGQAVSLASHPLARQARYLDLGQHWLTPAWYPARLRFRLFTPVWHEPDAEWPLVDPLLLLERLALRWNAFAPIVLEPAMLVALQHHTRLHAYGLQPRIVNWGDCQFHSAVGWVELVVRPYDPALASVLHLLGAFAYYAGLGIYTTRGFGQARPIGLGHQ
jgi:hypothetical protein